MSPRQLAIVPVFPSLDSYAQEIQKKLWLAGFQVDCDLDPGTTLNKKIRNNQLAQYNFIGGNILKNHCIILLKLFNSSCWSTRANKWND